MKATMSFDDDSEFDKILLNFENAEKKEIQTDLQNSIISLSEKCENRLSPDDFCFPFDPYEIQVDFMKNLYDCLEFGKIGIFESPTGTGKSLSLLCGALTWLKNFKEKRTNRAKEIILSAKMANEEQNKSENWLDTYDSSKELNEKAKIVETEMEKLKILDARLNLAKQGLTEKIQKIQVGKRKNISDIEEIETNEEECENNSEENEEFILTEYFSDDEESSKNRNDEFQNEPKNQEEEEEIYVTKIYYTVRTHSQLAQFLKELKKTSFVDEVRVITLGSRQNLCLNESVRKVGHVSLINDHCLQLQKGKSSKSKKTNQSKRKTAASCPYYRNQAIHSLSDQQLVVVQDVDQQMDEGRKFKACPYYASRYAVPAADVVLMPYQILLNKSVRDSCDIRLKGNVVIVDEAHNLIDTINAIHSVKLTLENICTSSKLLEMYRKRYETRLKAKNLMYIRQIITMLVAFVRLFGRKNGKGELVYKLTDFVFNVDLADMNFFKLLHYIEKSQISKKLSGFWQHHCNNVVSSENSSNGGCSLLQVESFVRCLINPSKDGRIIVNRGSDDDTSWLKFVCLNPASYFKDILDESRAVVLAGGTMQPTSDLMDQLFYPNCVSKERLLEFSCGHIIPDKNLLALTIGKGPTNVDLNFTYQSRNSEQLIDELGRVLINLTNVVPGGLVCFFPSYEYENFVFQKFALKKTIDKLEERKKIFREPKKSTEINELLVNYARFIKLTTSNDEHEKKRQNGAILFAVVGGKMSEGINFSDDQGRCVVMIGMPYPSKESAELREKMKFLNATLQSTSGQQYYENLCMKAVNQSIGRAIRHRNDYASIILLDGRYSKNSVLKKLPEWIARRISNVDNNFGSCLPRLKQFYDSCK